MKGCFKMLHWKRNKIFNLESGLFVVLSIIILILRLWYIADLNGPFLWNDEMGYWSHAANMAGLSWTETEELWYSYGYSLILVPLFWITHNMQILYRLAIIMNALMGIASFILGILIIQELELGLSKISAMLCSFTAVCYSAYLFQSSIAWSETFLYTWFMLVMWLAICFSKSHTWKNFLLFTFSCCFLYIIHNRSIVVFIAYAIVMLFLLIRKEIDWKKAASAVCIIIGVMIVNGFVKEELSLMMWGVTDGFSGNDLSSQGSKLQLFLSVEGWITLIKSLFGKLWYLMSSTLMLGYFGLLFIFKRVIIALKNIRDGNKNKLDFLYLFLSLFICGTIAVATISMYGTSNRLDIYFYGRYSDVISGILIIFGLSFLIQVNNDEKYLIECVAGFLIYTFISYILYRQIGIISDGFVNTPCVPGIYFFENFSCIRCTAFVIGIFFFYTLFIWIFYKKKVDCLYLKYCILISVPTIIFIQVANNATDCYTLVWQSSHNGLYSVCDILSTYSDYDVYLAIESFYTQQAIRVRAVESEISYKFPSSGDTDCFVLVDISTISDLSISNDDCYYYIENNSGLILLAKGELLADELLNAGYSVSYLNSLETINLTMDDLMSIAVLDDLTDQQIAFGDDLSFNINLSYDVEGSIVDCSNYLLSYHIYDADGNMILWDGERFDIGNFVSSKTVEITIDAENFADPGEYLIQIDLVEEGVAWLSYTSETLWMNVNVE